VGAWVWGPASVDVAITFIERWNAFYPAGDERLLPLPNAMELVDGGNDRLADAPAAPADTATNVAVHSARFFRFFNRNVRALEDATQILPLLLA